MVHQNDSTVLFLKPNSKIKNKIKNIENLEKITHIFFSKKRKMINKSFTKLFKNSEILSQKLNIDLSLRPNQLNENDFYKIVEYYEKYKKIWNYFLFFLIRIIFSTSLKQFSRLSFITTES